ncbi:Glucanosyltransferase-domain-containing protein [Calycina marina]|uniref:1,3-beta-glucanosyltransferase n=1 Tax=Calycina marina TaxID=1763456 RepID=A0A9P8CI55_9HELO|nr:Glucanosyltransferase-domain-containing protein [Calycina marina]
MFKIILLIAVCANVATSLSTISIKGAKFFTGGQQFFLKGVAYQGTPDDPLVDTQQCILDAESMATIGTNSIRVYHVDPYSNHDGCMAAFSAKGIYIWLDLDTFNTTITQDVPTWTDVQFVAFTQVMDAFHEYENLAGFWIGNEVITSLTGSSAAPYIKAAVADMKSYITAKAYRAIPIGYSAADIAELRPQLQNYLACSNASTAIDFFGLNSYEWCGDVTYITSGYSNLQAMSEGYNIPIFFSETGCNSQTTGGRSFTDQAAIFGSEMVDTWSGSIIYEWVQETNDYGLVTYPDGEIYSGAPIPIQPDFDNIKNEWASASPVGVSENVYAPSFSAPACPASSGGWQVNGNVALPTLSPSLIADAANQIAYTAPPSNTPSSTSMSLNSAIPSTSPLAPSLVPIMSSAASTIRIASTASALSRSPEVTPISSKSTPINASLSDPSTTSLKSSASSIAADAVSLTTANTSTATSTTETESVTGSAATPSPSKGGASHFQIPFIVGGALAAGICWFG